jgi:ABC-type multidrug transport system fused ATPase/permease subunit
MKEKSNLEKKFFNSNKYPALRTVAGIYILYSYIIGIASLFIIFDLITKDQWRLAFFYLVGISMIILISVAIAESIRVFIDIEYNTRKALENTEHNNRNVEKIIEKEEDNKIEKDDRIDSNTSKFKIIESELELKAEDIDKISKLKMLIEEQKNNFFGNANKNEIIKLTFELCKDNKAAENLLYYYKVKFNSDLLASLKALTSNYEGIKQYLQPFIELGIVQEEFPHDKL